MPWIICLAGLDPKFFSSRRACVPFIGYLVVYLDQAPSLHKFSSEWDRPGRGWSKPWGGGIHTKGGGDYRGKRTKGAHTWTCVGLALRIHTIGVGIYLELVEVLPPPCMFRLPPDALLSLWICFRVYSSIPVYSLSLTTPSSVYPFPCLSVCTSLCVYPLKIFNLNLLNVQYLSPILISLKWMFCQPSQFLVYNHSPYDVSICSESLTTRAER